MSFFLFWFDFYLEEMLFGFGFFSFKTEQDSRNLLAIYWNDGQLLIDFIWCRVCETYPEFWFSSN